DLLPIPDGRPATWKMSCPPRHWPRNKYAIFSGPAGILRGQAPQAIDQGLCGKGSPYVMVIKWDESAMTFVLYANTASERCRLPADGMIVAYDARPVTAVDQPCATHGYWRSSARFNASTLLCGSPKNSITGLRCTFPITSWTCC